METPTRVWNAYHKAVFADLAYGEGHTVIEAVAGGTKTSTLVEGARYLPPGKRAIFCAFGNRTARTLRERLPPEIEVRTLHSLGNGAVWMAWKDLVGGKIEADDGIERERARALRPRWRYEDQGALVKLTGYAKNWLVAEPELLARLVDRYGCWPVEVSTNELVEGALDMLRLAIAPSPRISFDDMVWLPNALGLTPKRFDVVLVDEAQDLCRAQVELALRAMRPGARLIAVGDRNQAIFSFRGADPRSMERLVSRLGAKRLPLSVSYRCPRRVVGLARAFVPEIRSAPGAAEGTVALARGDAFEARLAPGDFVLSRVNAPLMGMALRALKRGLRAYVLGRDMGQNLRAFVERHASGRVEDVLDAARAWRARELDRLAAADRLELAEQVEDRVDTLRALCEDAESVAQVAARIERLFGERAQDPDARDDRVMFASTHRAKGLESDRVWVLASTYRPRASREEDNLCYVAVTRSRRELFLVGGEDGANPLARFARAVADGAAPPPAPFHAAGPDDFGVELDAFDHLGDTA